MTLEPHARIGDYRVIGPLGSGGMGEVYRARDERLGRDVAIKLLRADTASRGTGRARFEREMRAVAALSHPNIVTLHDAGSDGERRFAVMELLEGETLRSRLDRGALGWRKAAVIAAEVADALAAAHARGIVHRDLKPSNIFLTIDGRVKVLDFGVACTGSDGSGDELTAECSLIGTTAYLAPEQLGGETIDARADVFALGCVLSEMIAGRNPFQRPTATETLAAVLNHDPEPLENSPAGVNRVVAQCLAKHPESRFQSASDLGVVLRVLVDSGTSGDGRRHVVSRVLMRRALASGIAVFTMSILAPTSFSERPANAGAVIRSSLLPQANAQFEFGYGPMALSSDGRSIAFAARDRDGVVWLWVQGLGDAAPRQLPNTRDARFPFWSPDNRWLGFTGDGHIKKIHVEDGVPVVLCRGNGPGTWNRSGVILFSPPYHDSLFQVDADGRRCERITKLDEAKGERTHRWPAFLPDGRRFVYHAQSRSDPQLTGVYLASLDSPQRTFLMQTNHRVEIAPSGHLLFPRQRALLAAPFDLNTAQIVGTPVALTTRLLSEQHAIFSVSNSGMVVFAESPGRWQYRWVDRRGRDRGVLPVQDVYGAPVISPDGRRVAFHRKDPETDNRDIWVFDLERQLPTRLTSHPMDDQLPVWAPDSRHLAFTSTRLGPHAVFKADVTSADEEVVMINPGRATSWAADGTVAFELWFPTRLLRLSSGEVTKLPVGIDSKISPDGRWLAYESRETGSLEVWVRGMPPDQRKWRVSRAGGIAPRWRADGRELFYVGRGSEAGSVSQMIAVPVIAGDSLEFGTPVALFDSSRDSGASGVRSFTMMKVLDHSEGAYDVTPDGQKFLVRYRADSDGRDVNPHLPITLVQNWPALLSQRK